MVLPGKITVKGGARPQRSEDVQVPKGSLATHPWGAPLTVIFARREDAPARRTAQSDCLGAVIGDAVTVCATGLRVRAS